MNPTEQLSFCLTLSIEKTPLSLSPDPHILWLEWRFPVWTGSGIIDAKYCIYHISFL